MQITIKTHLFTKTVLLSFLFSITLTACSDLLNSPTPPYPTPPPPTPLPETLITFRLSIPEPLPPGDSLYLTILDEVTGLALNPRHILMEAEDAQHYIAILPLAIGSVVKYRYSRQGSFLAQEHISDGRPVRYRLYHVEGPGVVEDVLSRWTDTKFTAPTGRISGQFTDTNNGQPIPNLLVTAGGLQTFTLADGSYLLEGLPPGTHNLVAYALDGSYRTFQQGAVVVADSTTPASISLTEALLVNVTFTVIVPTDTPTGIPIRLAGNLYQLGNTFADLSGGVSTITTRMPILARMPDGRYTITMTLPAGADIRYKFTLGDGLWNAERSSGGNFHIRQIVIPDSDIHVYDMVDGWSSTNSAPISFEVSVPESTPPDEVIFLQFNPGYGWLEPVPMWPNPENKDNHHWRYILFNPLDTLGTIHYRYCRPNQCGSADDINTMGPNPVGHSVNTSLLPQTLVDEVESWAWLPASTEPATVPNIEIQPRGQKFMAGVAFQEAYHPSWWPHFPSAISDVSSLGANWLILRPTWTFTRSTPPVLEPSPSTDILWPELSSTIVQAHNLDISVGLYPTPRFPEEVKLWWQSVPRDFSWWIVWFEHYRTFILHHADIAARYGAEALILGGDWLAPALPGGTLDDESPSNVPEDAENRWRTLLNEIKSHYGGTLLWALPYPQGVNDPPPFLDLVDQIYILWSAPLASHPDSPGSELTNEATNLLDNTLLPFQQLVEKPIVLAVAYPSADGGSTGCISDNQGACIDFDALDRPNPDIQAISIDLDEQTATYIAMLKAVSERNWINGFVSQGYYPPGVLQDKSISIHGKPASGVIWFWFPKLLGE